MAFNKNICIFGTGGFGRETYCCLIDAMKAEGKDAAASTCFMVGDEHFTTSEVMGIQVIRQSAFTPENYDVVVAIGDPAARKKVVTSLPANTTYATIIHPNVVMSSWVQIGEGSIITAGTILTCNITIGKHAHLNLHTTIGHDCVIGDYFTTAPAANISGNCTLGNQVYIGTNVAVKQGVNIPSDTTVGMGAVVVKDITTAGVYIGNPLKQLIK